MFEISFIVLLGSLALLVEQFLLITDSTKENPEMILPFLLYLDIKFVCFATKTISNITHQLNNFFFNN